MKTWKPSTCDCKVEEIYNGTEIVGMGQVLNKCEAHKDVSDNELYETLMKEGHTLCDTLRILVGLDGSVESKAVATKISDGNALNSDVEYKWSFAGSGKNRQFQFEVVGASLTKAEKDNIKVACDDKLGLGKITIV